VPGKEPRCPARSRRIYFLLDFLVVAFFELFLAAFFFAMALSPPFVCANLRIAKIKVNVFLRLARFFLDALFALALIRASALHSLSSARAPREIITTEHTESAEKREEVIVREGARRSTKDTNGR
jgi:hypothetical protein